MEKIYDFKALTSKGKEIDFSEFKGKVLLIVNTASKCGFTPQFAGSINNQQHLSVKLREINLLTFARKSLKIINLFHNTNTFISFTMQR